MLAATLLLYALRPIRDPDFWWHLKTGDVMVQLNGLPPLDPFNYTGDGVVGGFQAVLLYGYWLWEVCASLLFRSFGFPGIFCLKLATIALLSGGVFFEMRRQRLSQFTMVLLAGLGTLVIVNVYHLERPQVFSLLFATLLVGMVSRISRGYPPTPMIVPLMVFWANVHRGFVVGDILLALAAAGFLIQYRRDRKQQVLMSSWAVAGILASFANPNGWAMVVELFNFMRHSVGPSHVVEYRNSWQLYLLQSRCAALCLWTLAGLNLAGLVLAPRRFWPDIFISLFIVAIGVAYIRNTGFIAVSLLPLTGWYVEQCSVRLHGTSLRYLRAGLCTLLVATVAWVASGEWNGLRSSHGPVSNEFPVNMAGFLKDSGLSGHLFNEYDAGGYLDWALYPQWRTFIDGREMDTRVSTQYLKIASGSREPVDGAPYYQLMLDRYRIDVVAMRIALSDGRIQPLLKLLLPSPDWTPVYLDDQSFVMARNTPSNAAAIRRFGLDRSYFLQMVTLMAGTYAGRAPHAGRHAVMLADILIYRGRRQEGEEILKRVDPACLGPGMREYLDEQCHAATPPRHPLIPTLTTTGSRSRTTSAGAMPTRNPRFPPFR